MRRHAMVILLLLSSSLGAPAPAIWAEDRTVSDTIDAQIDARLETANIAAAAQANDAELLRRIYLDLLGRIPTAVEAERYLDDASPDKQHRLIDALLAHDEMPVHWRLVFDGWLSSGITEGDFGKEGFLNYLEHSLRTNRPWNEMARDLLSPDIDDETERGAAYFLAARLRGGDEQSRIDAMTTAVASVLFGVQLQCAKCHDHPEVDDWQQDHYYGLASFLGRTQEFRFKDSPTLKERADGEVKFVTTAHEEKTARLMFLDGHVVAEPKLPADRNAWYAKGQDGRPDVPAFSRRQALADYAIGPQTPAFKRAIVNRLWKQLMGRGLVEPVDQMHVANPATHPELLDWLAEDFASHNFDLRRLLAGMLHSQTYLRSARWTGGPRPASELYAVAITRPLSPDQLAQSLAQATGHMQLMHAKYEREKKNHKLDEVTLAAVRKLLARDRDYQAIVARFRHQGDGFEANASQALFLTYNGVVQAQLRSAPESLVEELTKMTDNRDAARRAYLATLARRPSEEEAAAIADFLASSSLPRPDAVREVVWALLSSAEFRFVP